MKTQYITGHTIGSQPCIMEVKCHKSRNIRGNIEEICQKLSGKDDIWYATNIEIHDYVEAYRQLRYSADESIIYNPTLIDIWLDIDKKPYLVKSGQTIIVE